MEWQEIILENAIFILGRILLALLLLIIGKWIIGRITKKVENKAESKLDVSLKSFIVSLTKMLLYVLLLIIIASTLGIEMTSFIAILGAAGLAVGLALQGSLANFAGGVLILIFKPFEVGDTIETGEYRGKVQSIRLLYTTLLTRDYKTVLIPNGQLANNSIINFNKEKTRRVDLSVGVSYEDDIRQVKEVLGEIVADHDLILQEPVPLIRLAEHADSSVNFDVFVWTENENYWDVYYDLLEEIKITFDEKDITFPFPQLDVHLDK